MAEKSSDDFDKAVKHFKNGFKALDRYMSEKLNPLAKQWEEAAKKAEEAVNTATETAKQAAKDFAEHFKDTDQNK